MKKINKAIFLDRDGVINDLIYYPEEGVLDSPNSVKQFRISNGVIKALNKLKKLGYILILISNQPGVAKEKYTISEFKKIKKKMDGVLDKNKISFDSQYYCLHHPNAINKKYKKKCSCRKPKTKMLMKGVNTFNINLKCSFVIGDGLVDMKLAKKVRCRSIYIGNISLAVTKLFKQNKIKPFFIAHDLLEAVKCIEKKSSK